jgi:hypothetical protein
VRSLVRKIRAAAELAPFLSAQTHAAVPPDFPLSLTGFKGDKKAKTKSNPFLKDLDNINEIT